MFGRHLPLSEQALQVIEQIGEDMPGGFFIYKATGNEELLYANKAVFKIFGCETLEEFKELTGYTFKGMLYPDDYEKVSVSIVDQIEKSQGNLDYVEYRIVRKDGKVRWLDDYGHYVNSDVYGGLFYVFISDITEKRVQMEADKAVYTAVIDALSRAYNAVWLINDIATGSFSLFRGDTSEGSVHARPTKEALELLTYEDAKANYINNFVAPSDRERLEKELTLENIIANTSSKKVFGVVFKRVVGDKECYYRIEFTQVQLPNGKTGIVAGFKDVDEDVRKEQEIQQVLRDAIDTAVRFNGKEYVFIDTAGLRRKAKITEEIERYSVIRTVAAVERCDVAVVVIDATEGVTEQDAKIAGIAHERGKGIIIAVNKWDAIEKDDKTIYEHRDRIREILSFIPYADIVFISALSGQRLPKLFEEIEKVIENQNKRIGTGVLNEIMMEATVLQQPPSDKGRRLKLFYITQVAVKPPTFVIFVNDKELMHFSYTRYIENKIREAFGFEGTSLKFLIRERDENKK